MPFVEIDDYKIHYSDTGQGTPVVLLHNGFYSRETWNGVRGALATRYRVIDYDRFGYGHSTHIAVDNLEGDVVEHGVRELAAFVDALGLKRFHLVGHCLGGAIALLFAVRHPSRVKRVVGVAVGFHGDLKSLLKTDMTFVPFDQLENAIKRKMVAMHGKAYTPKLWSLLSKHKGSYIMSETYDIRPEVFKLKAPLFLINGDRDFYFDVAHSAEVYERLRKTARLWIVPACGHDVHMSYPDEFTKEVTAFFEAKLG